MKTGAERENFVISYSADEGALSEHSINADELGHAILGMNKLVKEASKAAGYKSKDVKLEVTTPAREGSLEVIFALLGDPQAVNGVLKAIGIGATATGAVAGCLFEVVKKIANRKIHKIEIDEQGEQATLIVDDGEKIVVDKAVGTLAANKAARESLNAIIHNPLAGKKGAKFKLFDESLSQVIQEVSETELESFKPLPEGSLESVDDDIEHINVNFTKVNFESKEGWEIKTAANEKLAVTMEDESFLALVASSAQEFRKDDLYEIELKVTVTSKPHYTQTSREVIKVTRHWASGDRRQV